MLQKFLKIKKQQKNREPSFDSVMAVVSETFHMDAEEIISKTRRRDVVMARQMVCLICREVTDLSYSYIGLMTGGRDHSTVIHAHKTMKAYVHMTNNGHYIYPDLNHKYVVIMKKFKKFKDDNIHKDI